MGEVWRSGLSSSRTAKEMSSVRVNTKSGVKVVDVAVKPNIYEGGAHEGDKRTGISITCTIASKGGGHTSVKAWYASDEFVELAEAMMRADPEAAVAAFEAAAKNPNGTRDRRLKEYHRRELAKLESNE